MLYQLSMDTRITSFRLSDVDTFNQNLVVTTNRSWASVDMENRQLIIDAPTPGFTSF